MIYDDTGDTIGFVGEFHFHFFFLLFDTDSRYNGEGLKEASAIAACFYLVSILCGVILNHRGSDDYSVHCTGYGAVAPCLERSGRRSLTTVGSRVVRRPLGGDAYSYRRKLRWKWGILVHATGCVGSMRE